MGRGGVDVRMDYGQMREMAAAYKEAAKDLEDVQAQMAKIGDMLKGGALIGDAGSLYAEILSGVLKKKIKTLQDKMTELNRDIQGAVDKTEKGVSTAQSRFA